MRAFAAPKMLNVATGQLFGPTTELRITRRALGN